MNVGVQMVFQSHGYGADVTDGQVVAEEVHLGVLADALGFDALWPVEHHFCDYAFCPDNTVFLAHMAARTQRILLGTGAVILPWNDPLRVAEKISLLDHLADGRVLFGVGRGLARREYEGFGIPMDESRGRFDEAARMVVDALETGWIEGDGRYYRQARTPIRPAPARSFRDRLYCVAMSPDSVLAAADLGARMVVFSQRPWEDQADAMATYRERFEAAHGRAPAPPVTCDFVYCDTDPARAEDKARHHLAGYLTSVMQHYELASDHFKEAEGYESYGNAVDLLRAIGLERMCEMYLGVQAWGTPEQVLERLRARREIIGDYDLTACFRYAGLPIEDAERSMRTFAAEVLPTLHAEQRRTRGPAHS
ncbi:MAG TPA: LLM class flavin-dependent oxidoreductase [Acidimicrobiales bacterium]|nr:LLM class flavin-dependent oxidoreductase [Acidimicrobiales bacterium]